MFDELNKYYENNHFVFKISDNLNKACNAPKNKSGVYIIYALSEGQSELIYIGCSGKINLDGTIFIRKAGLGGIKDRLVNGKQFGLPRRNSWKTQMLSENIEELVVYWYATHDDNFIDCPKILENNLLKKYFAINGKLPRWNNEF